MPAVVEAPLAVLFTLPGGVIFRRRLDDLPNLRLAGDLAAALVAATHPHGHLVRPAWVLLPRRPGVPLG